jgi:hypothetical protein
MGATFGYNRQGPGEFVSTDRQTPFRDPFPASEGVNVVVRLGLAVGLGG